MGICAARAAAVAGWRRHGSQYGEGIFNREELSFHLRMSRWQVLRFVRALVRRGFAAENKFEEIAKVEQAILKGNIRVPGEYGSLQAAL